LTTDNASSAIAGLCMRSRNAQATKPVLRIEGKAVRDIS